MDDDGKGAVQAVADAEAIQRELAPLVELRPLRRAPETVAAVDADYDETFTYAAAVLCGYRFPEKALEKKVAIRPTSFPYLPGHLSLREAPAALEALGELSRRPDVLLVDGQGIAHPRRFGIACHIGVVSGIPAIGCAKTHLIGDFREPGPQRGDWSPLEFRGEILGAVLRTRDRVKPLFISPGHLVTLEEAMEIVLHCATQYRLPEPLRIADSLARVARKSSESA